MLRRSGGGTAALLNKVSSQLKGEKVKTEDPDDGLGVSEEKGYRSMEVFIIL